MTNTPGDISGSVANTPIKPEVLKEQLYVALVQQQGYSMSDKPIIPGYFDCVRKDGIEISGVILPQKPEIRVDVSVLVNAFGDNYFSSTNCGGLHFLAPKEQIYVTGNNLTEVLEKLVDIGERGRIIIDKNPDKRII